jgi:Fe-S cluster biogenesis protein NfuA
MTDRGRRALPDLSSLPLDADDSERMRALIEILSAYIEHFHGGAVEMVAFDGETLQVRLAGNCHGCRLSEVTLHGWVEGTVKPFFPKVRQVVGV